MESKENNPQGAPLSFREKLQLQLQRAKEIQKLAQKDLENSKNDSSQGEPKTAQVPSLASIPIRSSTPGPIFPPRASSLLSSIKSETTAPTSASKIESSIPTTPSKPDAKPDFLSRFEEMKRRREELKLATMSTATATPAISKPQETPINVQVAIETNPSDYSVKTAATPTTTENAPAKTDVVFVVNDSDVEVVPKTQRAFSDFSRFRQFQEQRKINNFNPSPIQQKESAPVSAESTSITSQVDLNIKSDGVRQNYFRAGMNSTNMPQTFNNTSSPSKPSPVLSQPTESIIIESQESSSQITKETPVIFEEKEQIVDSNSEQISSIEVEEEKSIQNQAESAPILEKPSASVEVEEPIQDVKSQVEQQKVESSPIVEQEQSQVNSNSIEIEQQSQQGNETQMQEENAVVKQVQQTVVNEVIQVSDSSQGSTAEGEQSLVVEIFHNNQPSYEIPAIKTQVAAENNHIIIDSQMENNNTSLQNVENILSQQEIKEDTNSQVNLEEQISSQVQDNSQVEQVSEQPENEEQQDDLVGNSEMIEEEVPAELVVIDSQPVQSVAEEPQVQFTMEVVVESTAPTKPITIEEDPTASQEEPAAESQEPIVVVVVSSQEEARKENVTDDEQQVQQMTQDDNINDESEEKQHLEDNIEEESVVVVDNVVESQEGKNEEQSEQQIDVESSQVVEEVNEVSVIQEQTQESAEHVAQIVPEQSEQIQEESEVIVESSQLNNASQISEQAADVEQEDQSAIVISESEQQNKFDSQTSADVQTQQNEEQSQQVSYEEEAAAAEVQSIHDDIAEQQPESAKVQDIEEQQDSNQELIQGIVDEKEDLLLVEPEIEQQSQSEKEVDDHQEENEAIIESQEDVVCPQQSENDHEIVQETCIVLEKPDEQQSTQLPVIEVEAEQQQANDSQQADQVTFEGQQITAEVNVTTTVPLDEEYIVEEVNVPSHEQEATQQVVVEEPITVEVHNDTAAQPIECLSEEISVNQQYSANEQQQEIPLNNNQNQLIEQSEQIAVPSFVTLPSLFVERDEASTIKSQFDQSEIQQPEEEIAVQQDIDEVKTVSDQMEQEQNQQQEIEVSVEENQVEQEQVEETAEQQKQEVIDEQPAEDSVTNPDGQVAEEEEIKEVISEEQTPAVEAVVAEEQDDKTSNYESENHENTLGDGISNIQGEKKSVEKESIVVESTIEQVIEKPVLVEDITPQSVSSSAADNNIITKTESHTNDSTAMTSEEIQQRLISVVDIVPVVLPEQLTFSLSDQKNAITTTLPAVNENINDVSTLPIFTHEVVPQTEVEVAQTSAIFLQSVSVESSQPVIEQVQKPQQILQESPPSQTTSIPSLMNSRLLSMMDTFLASKNSSKKQHMSSEQNSVSAINNSEGSIGFGGAFTPSNVKSNSSVAAVTNNLVALNQFSNDSFGITPKKIDFLDSARQQQQQLQMQPQQQEQLSFTTPFSASVKSPTISSQSPKLKVEKPRSVAKKNEKSFRMSRSQSRSPRHSDNLKKEQKKSANGKESNRNSPSASRSRSPMRFKSTIEQRLQAKAEASQEENDDVSMISSVSHLSHFDLDQPVVEELTKEQLSSAKKKAKATLVEDLTRISSVLGIQKHNKNQMQVIESIYNENKNISKLMLNSSGKSTLYQTLAMMDDTLPNHFIIVVTSNFLPLRTKMNKQVSWACIYSQMGVEVLVQVQNLLMEKKIKLLFIQQEYLLQENLRFLKNQIKLIIYEDQIDKISEINKLYNIRRYNLFHTTCFRTKEHLDSISSKFSLHNLDSTVRLYGFDFANMHWTFETEKEKSFINFIRKNNLKKVIMYIDKSKKIEEIVSSFNQKGLKMHAFNPNKIDSTLALFVKDSFEILCCYNGQVVPKQLKSLVQYYIHYHLPRNVLSYLSDMNGFQFYHLAKGGIPFDKFSCGFLTELDYFEIRSAMIQEFTEKKLLNTLVRTLNGTLEEGNNGAAGGSGINTKKKGGSQITDDCFFNVVMDETEKKIQDHFNNLMNEGDKFTDEDAVFSEGANVKHIQITKFATENCIKRDSLLKMLSYLSSEKVQIMPFSAQLSVTQKAALMGNKVVNAIMKNNLNKQNVIFSVIEVAQQLEMTSQELNRTLKKLNAEKKVQYDVKEEIAVVALKPNIESNLDSLLEQIRFQELKQISELDTMYLAAKLTCNMTLEQVFKYQKYKEAGKNQSADETSAATAINLKNILENYLNTVQASQELTVFTTIEKQKLPFIALKSQREKSNLIKDILALLPKITKSKLPDFMLNRDISLMDFDAMSRFMSLILQGIDAKNINEFKPTLQFKKYFRFDYFDVYQISNEFLQAHYLQLLQSETTKKIKI